MNHSAHLKQMLIIAAVVAVGLLAFGAPTGTALRSAAVLACPLGMIAMMFMMRGSGHNHDRADNPGQADVDLRNSSHQHH